MIKMKLQLQILFVTSYWITGLLSDNTIGSSCELNSAQNGICRRFKNCPYAKALIKAKRRPIICEFIGREAIVCCPSNEISKTNEINTKFNKFKRPECALLVIDGTYEPPGMTDRPSQKRHKIIDNDGLVASSPPTLLSLSLPPLPTQAPLPSPQSVPLNSAPPLTPLEPAISALPSINDSLQREITTSTIKPMPTPWIELLELPALPPRPENITLEDLTGYLDGYEDLPEAIAGGIHAGTAEFPHMARLGIGINKSTISWYCGGSLITDKFILTAAHCSHSKHGAINWARLGDPVDLRYEEVHEVINNIFHPDYNPFEHYHDIALSELKDNVQFNFYISPVCVHTEEDIPKTIRLTVSGWGAKAFGEEGSEDLLKADLELYSYEECSKRFPKTTRKLPRGLDNETHICAGGREEIKDTCQGDSGGPLQMRGANESFSAVYSIIGVTSFGKICGRINQPGVYIRIYPYLPWIESVVWKTP